MPTATKILNRVIGVQFYQRNAGLFLFIFILMFGIIPGPLLLSYHLTLIHAMLDSSIMLTGVCFVWLLYAMKCAQFAMKTFSEPQHQFLYIVANLTRQTQFISLLAAQLFMYLPVLIYSMLVAIIGFANGKFPEAMIVLAFNSLLCFGSTLWYQRKLNHPNPEIKYFLSSVIRIDFVKPFPWYFISQLMNEMKVIFVVTKFFSVIIIIAFLNGFFIDNYDSRVVMLGFLAGLAAHCVMIFEFRKFEETFLSFYRNLPVTLFKRFFLYGFIYLLILLPEWIIFGSAIPGRLHPLDAPWLIFFGAGMLLLFNSLLYHPKMDMDRYLQWVFGILAALFFLILYRAFLFIDAMLILSSFLIFRKWYYRYERAQEAED